MPAKFETPAQRVHIMVPEEWRNRLHTWAEANNMSPSAAIRRAVDLMTEGHPHGSGHPDSPASQSA